MKKIVFNLVLCILLVLFSGCSYYYQCDVSIQDGNTTSVLDYNTDIEKITLSESEVSIIRNCKLFVESTDITNNNYVIINVDEKYAEIPILAVLRAYGATICNSDDNEISISLNENDFTFYTNSPDLGIAIMPGGSTSVRKIVNDDLIFDDHSIRTLLRNMGNIEIAIDYNNMEILIEKL